MAQSVSNLLAMLLLLVCGMRAQSNTSTFSVIQSPRSTNVTLLEGDNVFLSFVTVKDVDVQRKIIKYYKNGKVDRSENFTHHYASSDKNGILLLNKTEKADINSAYWPFTTDGVQYIEHIMRVAYGKQLTNVSRLNIQFELVDSSLHVSRKNEIITFNIMLMSAITSESSMVGCTTMVQPMITRDPILDTTPQPFYPSASLSNIVPHIHTSSPSVQPITVGLSVQPITVGLSVSGTVILIVVIIVVAFTIYFACRVTNSRTVVKQMDREQRVTENERSEETSNPNSIKTTHDIFSNNDSGNLSFKNNMALQRDNEVDSEKEEEEL